MSETGGDSVGSAWLDEASVWALRLREDLGADTVAAFEAWRTSSPAAGAAWREVSRLWTLAGVALAVQPRPGSG